jgi:hypothetical protein
MSGTGAIDLTGTSARQHRGSEIDRQRNAALAIEQRQRELGTLAERLAGGDYTLVHSTRWNRAVEAAVKDLGKDATDAALRERALQHLRFIC